MNFRRQPFQFSTIDPVKRQAELQKRFGLPSTNNDMFVDFFTPGAMGSGIKEPSSLGGSPRLQHRMPIFTEKAAKGNSEQNNVDGNHKPRVRVIPIQVEGVDGDKRHRTFSGPAGMGNRNSDICNEKHQEKLSHLDSAKIDEKLKEPNQPRVCTIPIQIEPREETLKGNPIPPTTEPAKKLKAESNGCEASNEKKEEPDITVPLKQIEDVLNKLKLYTGEVEKFTGTSKDKQYRYLDEMLTRCMLDLDNVDTMGLDKIRKARKGAVRQVQHYVDLLDTKVNERVEKIDSDSPSIDNLIADSKDEQMMCDIPTEDNNTMSSDFKKCNEFQNLNNKCVSSDVTMCSDAQTNSNITDVDMIDDSVPEVLIGKISAQDSSMENKEEDSKNESKIVIEELDDSSENVSSVCTSVINDETVSCVISDSPELNVEDTIIEEGNSEIVIEEVGDLNENDSLKACGSSVDKLESDEKLSVEQIKSDNCGITNANLSICASVVQEDGTDSKKL